jgi:hypothetical protein
MTREVVDSIANCCEHACATAQAGANHVRHTYVQASCLTGKLLPAGLAACARCIAPFLLAGLHFTLALHAPHSALPCPALPCPALPCPALPCPALPCPALPCPVCFNPFLTGAQQADPAHLRAAGAPVDQQRLVLPQRRQSVRQPHV